MTSIFTGQGYFFNDDRASGGAKDEDDILGCNHVSDPRCTPTMKRSKWKLSGGMCYACNRPICGPCYGRVAKFGCEGPEIKRILQAAEDVYRRDQNAKVLGL